MPAASSRSRTVREEPGELAEDKSTVPARGHILELVKQRVDLAAGQVCLRAVDQRGVQAELAQQGQRRQDREPVGVDVGEQPEDLLPLPLQVRLVELAVPRVQFHLEHLLLLRRQVGGHLLLGAALEQRPDPPPQLGEQLGVALPFDRPGVVVAKRTGFGNSPGAVIDSSDHSSIRLFSIGVPVMATLNGARSRRAHW